MTDLPGMMMYWGRFFEHGPVDAMPAEAQGIWALMLGKMWLNNGWLKADDAYIAAKLKLDIRRWRSRYKPLIEPLLRREIDPYIGAIYTQKTLTEVRGDTVNRVMRNKARTARARATKVIKSRQRQLGTEQRAASVTRSVTEPVTETGTEGNTNTEREEALPIKKAESFFSPKSQDLGALPPKPNGEVEGSAPVASPGLEGRSLPAPSERLLRSKIVAGNGTSLAERLDAAQRAKEAKP